MFNEWFWIKKDPEVLFNDTAGLNYPYFTDAEAFEKAEDKVVIYKQEKFFPYDFLFEPTFLINDRLLALFELLEPSMTYKGVQFYRKVQPAEAPSPLFWLPYLPCVEAIHENSKIVQGKAHELILKEEALEGRRIVHCHLPADDIWLLSLEAAECLLRRQPIGIELKTVFSQS